MFRNYAPGKEPPKIAVLLNKNARHVNDALAKKLAERIGSTHLYYSRSLSEAQELIKVIVQQRYAIVATGGGDGTFIQTLNLLAEELKRHQLPNDQATILQQPGAPSPRPLELPYLAFLNLGTGNSLRSLVGSSGDPFLDLERLQTSIKKLQSIPFLPVPVISLNEQKYCLFTGLGYDSLLLNDYQQLLRCSQNSRLLKPFKSWFTSLSGYLLALSLRTLPRLLLNYLAPKKFLPNLQVEIGNQSTAYYIDPQRGDTAISISPGTTLFKGPATFVGLSTIPFYGYNFKMYPFAGLHPEFMQLRVTKASPLRLLPQVVSIWKGTYRAPHTLWDFWVKDVYIRLQEPYPLQHSGDDQGLQTEIKLQIAPFVLKIIDYYQA